MATTPQLTGALAGRYELEREIGSGGMATVYLARDLKHQRHVALKLLKPELGALLGVERFLSEIRVTASLQHPNLLPLFDSGEVGGLLYYVMPYVEGESLRARLQRERQLPVDEAVRIATAVTSALTYAHEHGVIHRDLKPENILLQAGHPVIADFGIALAVSNAGGARVTQTGLSLGTPQYMSPEQATGDRALDARSDIYSLGAVTYEMLAGEPPHTGPNAQAIIAKVVTAEPAPLRTLRPAVPVNVECAVETALAKLPADRFRTAREFAEALNNAAFTHRPTQAHVARGAAPSSWRQRAAIPLAALALVATTVAAWALLRPARATSTPVTRFVFSFDPGEALSGGFGRVALSSDGQFVAYNGGPHGQLLLRARDELHSTPVPGTEGAASPAFSPDGERVAFFNNISSLSIVSRRGGPPVRITDSLVGAAGASWGRDGYIYTDGFSAVPLVRVEARPGGKPHWFTALDTAAGELDHSWPDVLPNGKGVLFTVRFGGKGRRGWAIAVAEIPSGRHRVLVDGLRALYSPSGHLLYVTEDGTLMLAPFDQRAMKITGDARALTQGVRIGAARSCDVAVSRTGTLLYATGGARENRELVWVTREGHVQAVDSSWRAPIVSPSLSPDGTRVAVGLFSDVQDIWVKQLDRGPSVRLTFEGSNTSFPTWTPDGRSVTYASNAAGMLALWTKRADGSAPATLQLRRSPGIGGSLWSSDGAWLIYRTQNMHPYTPDIFAVRPGRDTTPVPIAATQFDEYTPTISPDGHWLAYASNETGRLEVYVVPFPNAAAAKWLVSARGGSEPLWSRRGDELFYRDGAGNLVSVAVKTSPTFAAGRQTILFPAGEFFAIPTHTSRQYDVSPDGRRFLTLRPVGAQVPERLVVVENWFAELRGK